ncbi:MAG: sigma-70 family RNA polymerase sigma factor [Saprospiraceae bacterium]|nr:sigma-70 family RNA polymerase sigma factor [Saprospiraceae bacterium]HMS67091.1 sigma-70 family RNA polymerase sigma factor [Saprospiraceae bacterium]
MTFDLHKTLQACKAQEPKAQQVLYDHYKGILFGLCRRYLTNFQEAEDVFVTGFTKIFSKLDTYSGEGSFEGWMKKIMVNEALMAIRSKKLIHVDLETVQPAMHIEEDLDAGMDIEIVLDAIKELPDGYRTVFNLYEVEGYKHKEIAEELGISINTSKSQLILAKKRLRDILKKKLETTIYKIAER